jgi:flagellin
MNAMNSHRQMMSNVGKTGKAMEKLSSGLRINRAGDDAAGLAISEKMRGQIRGLDQASRNAQDGISLIQTGEGALNETHSILQRMRELSVQAANDTNVNTDREKIQSEMDQLAHEVTRIADTTEFNTQKLLDGTFENKEFQIGANKDQQIKLSVNGMNAKDLGIVGNETTKTDVGSGKLNVTNHTTTDLKFEIVKATGKKDAKASGINAAVAGGKITITLGQEAGDGTNPGDAIAASASDIQAALDAAKITDVTVEAGKSAADINDKIDAVDLTTAKEATKDSNAVSVLNYEDANKAVETINNAINTVSEERSKLGAYQNRLEHTITNLNTSSENLQASESRVRDVDMAKEMMTFSKNNILSQAAQAMLAQANQQPQGVLQLLR